MDAIYIPHWLDSMRLAVLVLQVHDHLHSTLVRFYVFKVDENKLKIKIYIPHWLDSMIKNKL